MRNLVIGCVMLLTLMTGSVQAESGGSGYYAEQGTVPCVPPGIYEALWERAPLAGFAAQFPLYDWPLGNAIHDGLILVNYVDNDPFSGIRDYEGNPHAYDGHAGTDITMLNFHQMDEGLPILAAAEGVVTQIVMHQTDRNFNVFPNSGNWIKITHADASQAFYWHMRKFSATVNLGDTVERGEMIGLVGSSGFSTDAHLHFESGSFVGGVWTVRDPWNGSQQSLPSLWVSQEPYVGLDPVRIYDMDLTTQAAAGGNLGSIPTEKWKERMSSPAVMGIDETFLALWVQLQGQLNDSYTLKIYRPDSSIWRTQTHVILFKARYAWFYWYWSFASSVSSSDYGTWRAEAEVGGQVVYRKLFEVGPTTEYGPRLGPSAGRSFRINGSEQRDTLGVDALSSPVTFALENAPTGVTLVDDSIVTVAGTSGQPNRSHFLRVVATDGAGRTDTAHYHLVDMSKPLSCPIAKTGDVDGSGSLTSADIIGMVNFIFKGGADPEPCIATADVNCDLSATSADIIHMVNHVFKGGSGPCQVCPLLGSGWTCP